MGGIIGLLTADPHADGYSITITPSAGVLPHVADYPGLGLGNRPTETN